MLAKVKSKGLDKNFLLFILIVEAYFVAAFFLNHGWSPRVLITKSQIMHRPFHPFNDPFLFQPAPPLTATDLSGKTVNLAKASPKLQAVVFFSGCRECSLSYMRDAQALQDSSPNVQVQALVPDEAQDITGFLASHHLHLNFYTNSSEQNEKAYNIAWYPRLFLLDKQGRLIYIQGQDRTFSTAVREVHDLSATTKQ